MLTFKNKKIITFIFSIILLLGVFLPKTSQAVGGWYYATMSASATQSPAYGPFTQQECKEKRDAVISKGIANGETFDITPCKQIAKNPPVMGSELGMSSFEQISSSAGIEKFYFEYQNDDTKYYYVIFGGTTQKECEAKWKEIEKSGTDNKQKYVLSKSCKIYASEPKATPPPGTLPPNPNAPDTDTTYTPLAPLPDGSGGTLGTFDTKPSSSNPCPFGTYLNIIIKLFIGICAVLSMIMIVIGGIEYMTSELVSSKESGKGKIKNAILGLVLALGSYAILNTLNPKLLEVCLNNLNTATITISPETDEETIGNEGKTTTVDGKQLTSCKEDEITTTGSDGKPLSLFGQTIPGGVNKAIVKDVEAINTAWKNSTIPAVKGYKINSVGAGYKCRSVKGSPNKTSAHAFGLAIDINASTNPFEPGATFCKTDMPPEFVKLFTDQGWGWGGNWSSVKDAMHFSKLSSEVGHKNPCGQNKSSEETFDSATFNLAKKQIDLKILNYDKIKNHKISIYNGPEIKTVSDLNKFGTTSGIVVSGNTGYAFIKLTNAEYDKLKGIVEVALWSAGKGLGTKLLHI